MPSAAVVIARRRDSPSGSGCKLDADVERLHVIDERRRSCRPPDGRERMEPPNCCCDVSADNGSGGCALLARLPRSRMVANFCERPSFFSIERLRLTWVGVGGTLVPRCRVEPTGNMGARDGRKRSTKRIQENQISKGESAKQVTRGITGISGAEILT